MIDDNFASDGARTKFQRPACSSRQVGHVSMFLCTRKTFRCTFMRLKCVSISYPPPESPRIPRGSLKCTFMRLKCVSIGLSSAGVAAHPPARVSIAHLCVSNVSQSGFPPPESPRIPPPESQMHIHASQMRLNRAFLRRSRRASPRRSLKCVSIGLSSAGVAAHPPSVYTYVLRIIEFRNIIPHSEECVRP